MTLRDLTPTTRNFDPKKEIIYHLQLHLQKNVKAFLGSLTFLHRKFSSIIRVLDLNKTSPDVCFVTVLSDDLQPNMIKVHFHVTPRKLRDPIIKN